MYKNETMICKTKTNFYSGVWEGYYNNKSRLTKIIIKSNRQNTRLTL